MKADKRKRLEAAGWRIGSVAEYLGLSDEENLVIEMKLALAEAVRRRRQQLGWTQAKLATMFGSSQSRLAKLEAGEDDVSMELLLTALLTTGATRADVGRLLACRRNTLTHSMDAWTVEATFTSAIAWGKDSAKTYVTEGWPKQNASKSHRHAPAHVQELTGAGTNSDVAA